MENLANLKDMIRLAEEGNKHAQEYLKQLKPTKEKEKEYRLISCDDGTCECWEVTNMRNEANDILTYVVGKLICKAVPEIKINKDINNTYTTSEDRKY